MFLRWQCSSFELPEVVSLQLLECSNGGHNSVEHDWCGNAVRLLLVGAALRQVAGCCGDRADVGGRHDRVVQAQAEPCPLERQVGLAEQFRGAVVHISFVWGAVRVEVGKGGHVDDLRRRREDALVEALEGTLNERCG